MDNMQESLIYGTIVTGIGIIAAYIIGRPMSAFKWALLFVTMVALTYCSKMCASEYEYTCRLSAKLEIQQLHGYGHPVQRKMLTDQQRAEFAQKSIFHRREAERTWKDAEKLCWYLPDKPARERALDCFKIAMSAMVPGDPQTKLVVMLVALLTQYGIDCYNTWSEIENKLYWCNYHYEMYEEYVRLSCTGKY